MRGPRGIRHGCWILAGRDRLFFSVTSVRHLTQYGRSPRGLLGASGHEAILEAAAASLLAEHDRVGHALGAKAGAGLLAWI